MRVVVRALVSALVGSLVVIAVPTRPAFASAGLTTMLGGSGGSTSLSADKAADAPGAAWTTVTGPAITEFAAGDIGNGTLLFNVPTGFAFNTTGASVAKSSSGTCPLTASVTSQSASAITTTISGGPSTNGNLCTLTWSGIQVRPTAKTPLASSGQVTTGGTAAISGMAGGTQLGTLIETGGTATQLAIQSIAGCKPTIACTTQPQVTVKDAYGNITSSSASVTLALTTNPSGATLSATSNPVNASSGVATFSGVTVSQFGTGYVLTATSSGLTSGTITFDTDYGTCSGSYNQNCITSFKVDTAGNGTFTTVSDTNTTLTISSSGGGKMFQVKHGGNGVSDIDAFDVLRAGTPYGTSTVFEIGLNLGTFDPIETITMAEIQSYTSTASVANGNSLTIRLKPRAGSYLFSGCSQSGCGDSTTVADKDMNGMVLGMSTDFTWSGPGSPPPEFTTFKNGSRGGWVSTNAQSFSLPTFNKDTQAFQVVVGSAHFKKAVPTGNPLACAAGTPDPPSPQTPTKCVNTGFFKAFIPDAALKAWGISDPANATFGAAATISSSKTKLTPTPTHDAVNLGWVIDLGNITYSTPTVSIAPVPSISTLSQTTDVPAGGSQVDITGTALNGATSVTFGGTSANFTAVSSTLIRATSPAHSAGTGDVVVTTAGGASNAKSFTYATEQDDEPRVIAAPVTEPVKVPAPAPAPLAAPVTTMPTAPSTQPIVTTSPVQLGSDGAVTAPTTIQGSGATMSLNAGTTVRSGGVAFSGQLKPPVAATVAGVEGAYDFSPGTPLTFDRPISLTLPVPAGASASDFQPVTVDAMGKVTYLTTTSATGSNVTVSTDHLTVFGLARVPKPTVRDVAPSIPGGAGYHAAWAGQSDYVDLAPGQLVDLAVRFKNTGSDGWYLGMSGKQADLGSSDPLDNRRDFDAGVLVSPLFGVNRYATTDQSYVGPGDIGTFSMRLRAPAMKGTYQIRVRPLIEGVTWMEDEGVFLQINVK